MMDIIPVSVVVAPFRMVHCVISEHVVMHCPLAPTRMLTNTTATFAYERIWLMSTKMRSYAALVETKHLVKFHQRLETER
jgi:hypothetical protein